MPGRVCIRRQSVGEEIRRKVEKRHVDVGGVFGNRVGCHGRRGLVLLILLLLLLRRRLRYLQRLLLIVVLQREPVVGGIEERSGHDNNWAGSDQRPDHVTADDLALPAREINSKAGMRRGRGQERAGERQDLEAPVQGNDSIRRRGLPERNIGYRPGAAENADPALPPAGVIGHALVHIAPAADLQGLGSESVGAVAGYDYRGLRLVLGSGRSAPGSPYQGSMISSAFFGFIAVFSLSGAIDASPSSVIVIE